MPTNSRRSTSLLVNLAIAATLCALAAPARAELFVVDSFAASDGAVLMYDEDTGQFLGYFADNAGLEPNNPRRLIFPRAAAFGLDGDLFVSGFNSNAILRYTPIGGNLGRFADNSTTQFFGDPTGVTFHGGLVYVADPSVNDVKRYDPTKDPNQAFVSTFAMTGIHNPEGIVFGPDGNLYVANRGDGSNPGIARFNGTTGVLIGNLDNGSSGLQGPMGLAFGPDNKLYVADPSPAVAGKVLRYNIQSGAFEDFAVNIDDNLFLPRSIAFKDGKIYVGDEGHSSIRRFTAAGVEDGVFVASGSGGLTTPAHIIFAKASGGTKLILSFHWWGILTLTCLFGGLHLQARRKIARLRAGR
jgi:sugar lactone lactonase YvrE